MAQKAFFGKCEMGEMKQITQIQRRLKILMTIKILEKINFFLRQWRMRMRYGACAWSMAHAHRVWRKRIKYGVCAWSMAHAHGGWSIRLKYGVCVWSMAYAHGVWCMRVEYGA